VDTFNFTLMQRMAALALRYGMPAIGPLREFAADRGSHPSTLWIEFSGRFGSWAEGCVACIARPLLIQLPT
jgi:hypothetical protein